MSVLGNLLWFLLGGFIPCIIYLVAGLLLCITVIGIPFGVQCFKLAGLSAFPFGRDVEIGQFGAFGLIGNILWILLVGWELAITHIVLGLLFYITIIGIPFGRQHFKLARLAFVPFGATIK
jgi:uncharacterized membrane protein YccF (DUF307 family)